MYFSYLFFETFSPGSNTKRSRIGEKWKRHVFGDKPVNVTEFRGIGLK